MDKRKLIELTARDAGVTKRAAAKIVDACLKNIGTTIKSGERVALHDFGVFHQIVRPDRNGYDVVRDKAIKIPERRVIKFKPSETIKPE